MQAQLAVADHLGLTLSTVREMSLDEFMLWLEWLRMKAKANKQGGRRERRSMGM